MSGARRTLRAALLVALVALAWGVERLSSAPSLEARERREERSQPAREADAGARAVAEAFRAGRSDLRVELEGVVERLLADDRSGSRHQRFVIRLGDGHSLLVSHNIDLAPRVPLAAGDRVTLRGEYEWNERGGVIHWTHHDPERRGRDGWIRHRGRRYE